MKITFAGGLNENDTIDPQEAAAGQNFELIAGDTDFRPRLPFDLKGTSTLGGSISGILQLVKRDNTETTLIFDDDTSTPTIYLWNGASTFTSKRTLNLATGSKLRDVYWSLDDLIIITDIARLTPVLTWDATTVSRLKTGLEDGNTAAITSITRSGTTATVTTTASHSRTSGDLVHIAGAVETDYNGEFEITVIDADEFSYTVSGSPSTPATGTITWDLSVELYAKYSVVHQGRTWLFNVKTIGSSTFDTPHLMVASAFENHESYDTAKRGVDGTFTTGNEAFFMLTPDLKPINAAFVFMKTLLISTTEGQLFKLVGTDATDYQWIEFYLGSAAVGDESYANVGNDAQYMREGGNIESLIATQQFGDTRADDISRFIPDTVKDLTGAQVIYDKTNQRVLYFVASKVLVLNKDLLNSELSPWSIYVTALTAGDANALEVVNAAKYMRRPGGTTKSVYFGTANGKIYDFNGSSNGDANATDIDTFRKTEITEIPLGTILLGRVQYRRIGECELNLSFDWSDEYNESTSNITLKGSPSGDNAPYYNVDADADAAFYSGPLYYNQGFEFANKVSTQGFSPTGQGESYIMNASLDTKVRFKIDHIEI